MTERLRVRRRFDRGWGRTCVVRQILVAVDEGQASERVSEFVNEFFGPLDVSIVAVNVGSAPLAWGPYPAAPGILYPWPYAVAVPPAPAASRATTEPDPARDAAERRIDESGLQASDRVVEVGGDVADALRRIASERDVDMIVVGSTHKGLLDRLFSPSVSTDLAKSAPTPVLVVH